MSGEPSMSDVGDTEREDTGRMRGNVEPYTVKGILSSIAVALSLLARAVDRIASEYERRGEHV